MNSDPLVNEKLTIFDRDTDWYLDGLPSQIADRTAEDVFVAAKLTPLTRQVMERYYARKAQKKTPRKPTKARGRFHWKRKVAVAKRAKERQWRNNPYAVTVNTRGYWGVTRAEWDTHIARFWELYDPKDLKIKVRKGKAGRSSALLPYKIYDISLVHVKAGVLFDGDALKLWELSGGSGLRPSLDAVSS